MKGFNAHFGILLVFDNKQRTNRAENWEAHLRKIKNAYQKIEKIEVIDLECGI